MRLTSIVHSMVVQAHRRQPNVWQETQLQKACQQQISHVCTDARASTRALLKWDELSEARQRKCVASRPATQNLKECAHRVVSPRVALWPLHRHSASTLNPTRTGLLRRLLRRPRRHLPARATQKALRPAKTSLHAHARRSWHAAAAAPPPTPARRRRPRRRRMRQTRAAPHAASPRGAAGRTCAAERVQDCCVSACMGQTARCAARTCCKHAVLTSAAACSG